MSWGDSITTHAISSGGEPVEVGWGWVRLVAGECFSVCGMVVPPFAGQNRGRPRKEQTLSAPSTTWVAYPKPASNLLLLSAGLGGPSTRGFGFAPERSEDSTSGGGMASGNSLVGAVVSKDT